MKKIFWLVISAFIYGCSSGGGDSTPTPKNLFSVWDRTDNSTVIDLTNVTLSTPTAFFFIFEGGAQCDCDVTFIGSQSSGSYAINSCSYKFNSGSGNPGCNAINGTGGYTKTSDTLTFAPSTGGTIVYK